MGKTVRPVIVLILLFVSCGRVENKGEKAALKYFNITGLVREQIIMLSGTSPELIKTAVIDKDTAESVVVPDSSGWAREFELLLSADINKPRLADSYDETIAKKPGQPTLIRYVSLEPEKTHVDTLVIYQFPEGLNIRARIRDHNALYTASKTLRYHFRTRGGKLLLSGYTVEGWQKMIALDSLQYNIRAEVIYR